MNIELFSPVTAGLVLIGLGVVTLCYALVHESRRSRPPEGVPPNQTALQELVRLANEPVIEIRWREAKFGLLSIVWAVLGTPFVVLTILVAPPLIFLVPLAGVAFAIASWIRREKHPWIAGFGFLLNIAIPIWLYHGVQHIHLNC